MALKDPVKLSACPFCGNLNIEPDRDEFGTGMWQVVCNVHKQGCGAGSGWTSDLDRAIEKWNRRDNERVVAIVTQKLNDLQVKFDTLQKAKRPFTPEFTNTVIEGQVKEIDNLRARITALSPRPPER